jgi:hypothetical protein
LPGSRNRRQNNNSGKRYRRLAAFGPVDAEYYFHECDDETPNIVAARLMMGLTNDCQQDAIAGGHGYCGIMAMALVALRGLLPSLSGMIREHAAFFVDNSGLPLSAMPFAVV